MTSRTETWPLTVTRRLGQAFKAAGTIVAAIIVLGIVFEVFDANRDKAIVSGVHDVAAWLVGPFADLFTPHDPHTRVFVNWGIAAVVYLAFGWLLATLMRRKS